MSANAISGLRSVVEASVRLAAFDEQKLIFPASAASHSDCSVIYLYAPGMSERVGHVRCIMDEQDLTAQRAFLHGLDDRAPVCRVRERRQNTVTPSTPGGH